MFVLYVLILLVGLSTVAQCSEYWTHFGNNEKGHRFSPLTQINKENVKDLKLAWEFGYGEGTGVDPNNYAHEVTPLMVDDGSGKGRDLLIFCTPWNDIVALNPVDGSFVWRQNGSNVNAEIDRWNAGPKTCRGVATWLDPLKRDGDPCRRYVYMGTLAAFLVAVDAATGEYCKEFGDNGRMNLTVKGSTILRDGELKQLYGFSSAPEVVGNTVFVGEAISDGFHRERPVGQPRGFDTRTGRLKWTFFPIPQDRSDPAYATWENGTQNVGGGNVWAPLSGDNETGMVYLATSSAHFDYWGGNRKGRNEYIDSIVALDAETGEKRWHYQIIKHDVWNYDLACQPVVTTITHEGQRKKVILELTKSGMLFILDAQTGQPVFPVEERPVPRHPMPDDEAWPTQTFVVGELGNLTKQEFDPSTDLFFLDDDHRDWCLDHLFHKALVKDGTGRMFTPAQTDVGTFNIPGDLGGGNWMSLSVHPEKEVAVLPVNYLLVIRTLLRRNETQAGNDHCRSSNRSMIGSPYHACQSRFLEPPLQTPCYKPPWARMVSVDLSKGTINWIRPYASPLGSDFLPEIIKKEWGARRVLGGLIITASDLIFGSGGEDHKLWAYDLNTGEALFESDHTDYDPTSIPMTYMTGGRQYVVLNAGGHWTSPFERGDKIYAYALPWNLVPPTTPPSSTPVPTCPRCPPAPGVGTKPTFKNSVLLFYILCTVLVCWRVNYV